MELVFVENDTNFGHNNLIYKCTENIIKHEIKNGLSPSTSREDRIILKNFIKNIKDEFDNEPPEALHDDKQYIVLRKLKNMGKLNFDNHEKISDKITFCNSLFCPLLDLSTTDKDYETKWDGWLNRYFFNLIKFIIICKFHLENKSSIRLYLDHAFINQFLKFDKNTYVYQKILKIDFTSSYDYEVLINNKISSSEKIDIFLQNFVKTNKDELPTACHLFFKLINLAIENNYPVEIFTYELKDIFRDSNSKSLLSIESGYIGQLIRYICLKQVQYLYNGKNIEPNKCYIWRDAHTTTPGYNDIEIITSVYDFAKKNKKKINLIPSSFTNARNWHNLVICNNASFLRGIYAGINNFFNFSDQLSMTEDLYIKTIGKSFMITNKNKLALYYLRPPFVNEFTKKTLRGFSYGIEEFLLSEFFNHNKNENIYFKDHFYGKVLFGNTCSYKCKETPDIKFDEPSNLKLNYMQVSFALLINFLYKDLPLGFSSIDAINSIEKLRYKKNELSTRSEFNKIQFLLSLFPSKYFISQTRFTMNQYDYFNLHKILILENFPKDIYKIITKKLNDLTIEDLKKIGIFPYLKNMSSGFEWCPNLIENSNDNIENAIGFYDDLDNENIKKGIFLNPKQLEQVLEFKFGNIKDGKRRRNRSNKKLMSRKKLSDGKKSKRRSKRKSIKRKRSNRRKSKRHSRKHFSK